MHCNLCNNSNPPNKLVHLQYNHEAEYSEVSSKTIPDAQRTSEQLQGGQQYITEALNTSLMFYVLLQDQNHQLTQYGTA